MEYKVITKTPSELQKILNQWKNDYHLHIISATSTTLIDRLYVICILTRTPKSEASIKLPPLDDNFCEQYP